PRPAGGLLRMLGHGDAVHGLYYLVVWAVVRVFGTAELVTRLPSAVAMAVAAIAVAGIGRQLISRRAGLLAGLVFAVLPEVSRYGQEARSYATASALAPGASDLLVRVLNQTGGGGGRWWTAGGGAAAVADRVRGGGGRARRGQHLRPGDHPGARADRPAGQRAGTGRRAWAAARLADRHRRRGRGGQPGARLRLAA